MALVIEKDVPRKRIYVIPVRFEGRVLMEIEAKDEFEAMKIASAKGQETDCGELEDVDWDAMPSVDDYYPDEREE